MRKLKPKWILQGSSKAVPKKGQSARRVLEKGKEHMIPKRWTKPIDLPGTGSRPIIQCSGGNIYTQEEECPDDLFDFLSSSNSLDYNHSRSSAAKLLFESLAECIPTLAIPLLISVPWICQAHLDSFLSKLESPPFYLLPSKYCPSFKVS